MVLQFCSKGKAWPLRYALHGLRGGAEWKDIRINILCSLSRKKHPVILPIHAGMKSC